MATYEPRYPSVVGNVFAGISNTLDSLNNKYANQVTKRPVYGQEMLDRVGPPKTLQNGFAGIPMPSLGMGPHASPAQLRAAAWKRRQQAKAASGSQAARAKLGQATSSAAPSWSDRVRATGGGQAQAKLQQSGRHKHGSRPRPGRPAPKPADPITDQINSLIQGSERLTKYYGDQTEAQRQAVTADSETLSKAAGSLGTTAPLAYYATPTDPLTSQMANSYTDLVNAVGSGTAKQAATTNQAMIADSGNALQKLFGGQRNAADLAHVEYGRQVRANEPAMRRQKLADDQAAAMEAAKEQYLRDKLSLDGKKHLDNLGLGYDKLASQTAYQQGQLANSSKRLELDAADKAVKNSLKGQSVSGNIRKEVNAWVKANLYAKVTEGQKYTDKEGVEQTASGSQLLPAAALAALPVSQRFQKIVADMTAAGFPPNVIYPIAQNQAPGGAKSMGWARYFKTLVGSGMTARQAAKGVGTVFGKEAQRQAIKLKSTVLAG